MGTLRVYRYELHDAASRTFVPQRGYATEKAIVALRGVTMYSTGKDVPASEVDLAGIWIRAEEHAT